MKTPETPIAQIAIHPATGELFALDVKGRLWVAGRGVGKLEWSLLGGVPGGEPSEDQSVEYLPPKGKRR